jgi:predicted glycogen debranching enzyme
MEHLDEDKHVLLSSLDVSVVQGENEFNLGIHKYEGDNFTPKGHKYVRDFDIKGIPKVIYRVGSLVLERESVLVEKEERVLMKFTIADSNSSVLLKFRPFLAFRNIHSLSKSNLFVNTKFRHCANGIRSKLYDGYPFLYLQFSKQNEFVPVPDWYYNIEYPKELERGYDYKEDLFVPGYFEVKMRKGEAVVFSAGTKETTPAALKRKFTSEVNKREVRDNLKSFLANAAEQFIVKKDKATEVIAGYPWFGSMRRDTFIALPGLTLARDDTHSFIQVMDTMIKNLKDCVFAGGLRDTGNKFTSADGPLWLVWALQQYYRKNNNAEDIWKKYGKNIKKVFDCYKKTGVDGNLMLDENGLIKIKEGGEPMTWMDAMVEGKPVVRRVGYVVEVNALWYNALRFALDIAEKAGDSKFVKSWAALPEKIANSFTGTFWSEEKGYLADHVNIDYTDWSVRANMVVAVSMPYCPVNDEIKKHVLDIAKNELLTSRGLRTLSPKNPKYHGHYTGGPVQRDLSYHQGSVFPWLFQHFAEAWLSLYKKSGHSYIKDLTDGFETDLNQNGIGTLSELYDGDPPFEGKGAISSAGSVAAVLRVLHLIHELNS